MELMPEKIHEPEIIEDVESSTGLASRVILYNDEWHTFEEVIVQLMKATNCSFEDARDRTFEVHFKGKSIVFSGEFSACLKVSAILEEIALHTQVVT
jgi:ATP-dependent Clp protease adapter protein ClpS